MIHRRNNKKSKFQERLDEVAKKHRDSQSQVSQKQESPSAHPWIDLNDEKPAYYASVDILTDSQILEDWHRLSDGDHEFYANLRNNSIVYNPTHWRKRPGVKYIPYEPMTGG